MKIFRNKIIYLFTFFSVLSIIQPAYAVTRGVFFGTSKFDKAHDLPACENDAKDAYKALYQHAGLDASTHTPFCGENTKVLMRRYIQEAAKGLQKGDTLIIFNASHGSKDGDIVCADGKISGEEMAEWLKGVGSSNVVFINDSCYSSKFAQEFHKEFVSRNPGTTLSQIAAANPQRVSYSSAIDTEGHTTGHRNGVFTKFFIEGLDPDVADYNQDGKVTLLETLRHVKSGMLSQEHKDMVKLVKDLYPHRYQWSLEQLKNKRQEWIDYYYSLAEGDQENKKNALKWIRRYKLIIGVKTGTEGQRVQDPIAFGDLNFVLAQAHKESQLAQSSAANIYRQLGLNPETTVHVRINNIQDNLARPQLRFHFQGTIDVLVDKPNNKAVLVRNYYANLGQIGTKHSDILPCKIYTYEKTPGNKLWINISCVKGLSKAQGQRVTCNIIIDRNNNTFSGQYGCLLKTGVYGTYGENSTYATRSLDVTGKVVK